MKNKIIILIFVGLLCTGATCGISCSGTPIDIVIIPTDTPTNIPLDQANAILVISQAINGTDAAVSAILTTGNNNPLEMKGEQSISVNAKPLALTEAAGTYAQTVPAAIEYIISVDEPTRGILGTTITPPPAFDFVGPTANQAASLSGFTLTWSNPDPALKVEILLKQNLDGGEKRHSFGPMTDTGSQTFSATDLADFRWGKDILLSVTITKIREQSAINGFKNGKLTCRLANSELVIPGP